MGLFPASGHRLYPFEKEDGPRENISFSLGLDDLYLHFLFLIEREESTLSPPSLSGRLFDDWEIVG